MSKAAVLELPPKCEFAFDLCRRNDMLSKKGLKSSPLYFKTGTTIVGLIFQRRNPDMLMLQTGAFVKMPEKN
ncbi:hypothetical protein ACOSP7_020741 [Xanthoceras sorbifolium]